MIWLLSRSNLRLLHLHLIDRCIMSNFLVVENFTCHRREWLPYLLFESINITVLNLIIKLVCKNNEGNIWITQIFKATPCTTLVVKLSNIVALMNIIFDNYFHSLKKSLHYITYCPPLPFIDLYSYHTNIILHRCKLGYSIFKILVRFSNNCTLDFGLTSLPIADETTHPQKQNTIITYLLLCKSCWLISHLRVDVNILLNRVWICWSAARY